MFRHGYIFHPVIAESLCDLLEGALGLAIEQLLRNENWSAPQTQARKQSY